MSRRIPWISFRRTGLALLIAVCIALAGILPQQALAENYADPAPTIQPTTANGYSVLFDNAHGQTAGAADWVIDGGFSDFADALADEGYALLSQCFQQVIRGNNIGRWYIESPHANKKAHQR